MRGGKACAACACGRPAHAYGTSAGGGGVAAAAFMAMRRPATGSTPPGGGATGIAGHMEAGRAHVVDGQCGVAGQCGAAVIGRRGGFGRAGKHSPGKIREKCRGRRAA